MLVLGIGINPNESEDYQYNQGQMQELKDYIDKTFSQKIDLNTHIIDAKLNPHQCVIFNGQNLKKLEDLAFMNNSKRSEK